MKAVTLKYLEVARVNLRSAWAYLWNQVLTSMFLVVIMYVFIELWRLTFSAEGALISGYTMQEMLWYLVATEAIIFSLPRIHLTLESEVKNGDLAMRLNKPYNYLLFHYFAFAGEGLVKLVISFAAGGLTTYLLVGGFPFVWEALPVLTVIFIVTQALHFCYQAAIGIGAFWMEDITGVYFILDRLKWLLGGMLLPLEVFPPALRRIAEVLPFKDMVYAPARLFVKFAWADVAGVMLWQLVWLILFGGACALLYRLGTRKVDINGG